MARPEKDAALLSAIEAARKALAEAQSIAEAPTAGCVCGGVDGIYRPCAYHATPWNHLQAAIEQAERAARSVEAGP